MSIEELRAALDGALIQIEDLETKYKLQSLELYKMEHYRCIANAMDRQKKEFRNFVDQVKKRMIPDQTITMEKVVLSLEEMLNFTEEAIKETIDNSKHGT